MNLKKLKELININKKQYWDKQYSRMIDASEIRSDTHHLNKFLPFFEKSKIILDFGAGLGGNIQYLAGKLTSKEFILIDHSEVCLNFAQEKLFGKTDGQGNRFSYYQDLSSMDDGSIDMIMCIQVLEHITSYEEIIKSFWNKLKIGGILLISVPVKGFRDRNKEHVNKFTIKSTFNILSKYSEMVQIAPRTYSIRSGRLSTAYFLIEKQDRPDYS